MTIRIMADDSGAPDASTYFDVPHFTVGESYDWQRNQGIVESASGRLSVVDFGDITLHLAGNIENIDHLTAMKLKDWFVHEIRFAMGRFWIRFPNTRPSESFNPTVYVIYAGATVASVAVKCGSTYTAGERIPADYEYLGPFKTTEHGIKLSSDGAKGGYWNLSIKAMVEEVVNK